MPIDISPDTERFVREEIRSGHFRSVDELILSGVQAWREKNLPPASQAHPPRNLVEVCAMVRGLADDLDITRSPSGARPVDFE